MRRHVQKLRLITTCNTATKDQCRNGGFQSIIFNSSFDTVCFAAQHDKHNTDELVSGSKDGHFIGQALISPFMVVVLVHF